MNGSVNMTLTAGPMCVMPWNRTSPRPSLPLSRPTFAWPVSTAGRCAESVMRSPSGPWDGWGTRLATVLLHDAIQRYLAAVDDENAAGDVVRVGGGEERDRACKILRVSPPAGGRERVQRAPALGQRLDIGVDVGADGSRRNRVDPDPGLREVHRHGFHEHHHAALGRVVSGAVRLGQKAVRGGGHDDRAAGPGRRHRPGEPAADEEGPSEIDAEDLVPFLVGDVKERTAPPDT